MSENPTSGANDGLIEPINQPISDQQALGMVGSELPGVDTKTENNPSDTESDRPKEIILGHEAFYAKGREMFAEAAQAGKPISVIGFDVNRLKDTNDTFGHSAGNRLLESVCDSMRLRPNPNYEDRPLDAIGRVGGDEFAAVLFGDETAAQLVITRVLGNLQEAMSSSPDAEGLRHLGVGLSAGSATLVPRQPSEAEADSKEETFEELFDAADEAMYESKRQSRKRSPEDLVFGKWLIEEAKRRGLSTRDVIDTLLEITREEALAVVQKPVAQG